MKERSDEVIKMKMKKGRCLILGKKTRVCFSWNFCDFESWRVFDISVLVMARSKFVVYRLAFSGAKLYKNLFRDICIW